MKRKTIYLILVAICTIGFWLFENFYVPDTYSAPNAPNGQWPFPKELLPSGSPNTLVAHNHYVLSYSEPHEQAKWVAYNLKKEHLTYDDRTRPYFIEDPKVGSRSAHWRNYKNSGYDRGHLCPAGDRRFSEQAYNETFYTSNISPQDREFNAGAWNRLEQQSRRWCKTYGTLFIITGGILENDLEEIGDEDVDVPRYFYKIVGRQDGEHLKCLGFLMPNKASNAPLNSFLVPIDHIEQKTGIDFFEQLHPVTQHELESVILYKDWRF